MENNTNASKFLSNESSFSEGSANTIHWYTDEDINAIVVPQNFIQSSSSSLNSTLQNNATNSDPQTNSNPKEQTISQTHNQTFNSAIDQKLKSRLLNRCHLIIAAAEELIKQLERTKLADEASNNELLKRSLIKYFTKNILGKTKALQDNLCVLQEGVVERDLGDQMRSILTYIERFNKRRLEIGTCKKNVNHYEFLLPSARDFLTRELNKLADLAILNPPRPEEIEMDPVVNAQAIILQQQQKNAVQDNTFQLALKNVCTWARQRHAEVSVFISYAWSSEHRPWEQWVQPFLQTLKLQLELAGILVYMDIYDSRYGFNSYHHMNRIESCHHVIVIGTESLLDKFQRGVSAVCYELNEIRKRREQDTQAKRFSVIPLIINGTMRTALPSEYERFTVIESFLGGSYVQTVKELLAKLYYVSPGHPDFVEAWQPCAALIAQQIQTPITNIEQPHAELNDNFGRIPIVAAQQTIMNSYYLNKLKTVYQDKMFSGVKCLFNDETMAIEDYYVNLALIKEAELKCKEEVHLNSLQNSQPIENVPFDDTVTVTENGLVRDETSELFNRAEHLFEVQEPIELKDIFKPLENNATNRLLIIGSAGIGKTTLCQYIANQWAQGKLWSERYQGIFRIPLRNLIASRYTAKRNYGLLEIINQECFANRLTEQEQRHLNVELKNYPERYLIILDGYDELSNQTTDQYLTAQALIFMEHPEVIVTSRPQPVEFAADKKLEILGFTEKNIERYITNFFNDQQDKSEKLLQQLRQQSFLKSLAHIPINLELICSAWQSQSWTEEQSLTDLYQHLVDWLQYRYLKKYHSYYNREENFKVLANLTLIEKETLCNEWLIALENIAWQMCQKGSIYISKNQLIANDKETPIANNLVVQLNKSGLLKLTSDKQIYYFAHLTFQEFFAARYAAKVIKNAGNQGNVDYEAFQIYYKTNKFNPKLQIVWWFIAGLLKHDSKALNRYFYLLLQEPRDILVVNELPLFIHCLEQADLAKKNRIAQQILEEVVKQILVIINSKNSSSNLSLEKLKRNMLSSLGLCVKLLRYKVMPALVKWMNNDDKKKMPFIYMVDWLGKKAATDDVINTLLNFLDSNDHHHVVLATVRTLGQMGERAATNEVIKKLLYFLNSNGYRDVRLAAIEALGQMGEKVATREVIEKLLNLLRDKKVTVSSKAAETLGLIGKKTSLDIVCKRSFALLKDTDWLVRSKAAEVLGLIGDKAAKNEVIEKLFELLFDSDENVRCSATIALYQLGETVVPHELCKKLVNLLDDNFKWVRSAAAKALGKMGKKAATEEAVEKLIGLLNDNYDNVRCSAAVALSQLSTTVSRSIILKNIGLIVEKLVNLLSNENTLIDIDAVWALKYLGEKVAPDTVIRKLVELINHKDKNIRLKGIEALGCLSGAATDRVIEKLGELLNHKDKDVRFKTIEALERLGKAVTDTVIGRLGELLNHTDKEVKLKTIEALGWLSEAATDTVIKKLGELLNHTDKDVKFKAIEALGRQGEKAAKGEIIKNLWRLLDDKNFNVRILTVEALVRIEEKVATNNFLEKIIRCGIVNTIHQGYSGRDIFRELCKKPSPAKRFVLLSVINNANFKYLYPYLPELFIGIPLTVRENQLNWYEPTQGQIKITLSETLLPEFKINIDELLKREINIIRFFSQATLIETSLMQAASQDNLLKVQSLVNEGTDTRCMNSLGLLAVNKAHNDISVLEWLIAHHQPIDIFFLENLLIELEYYQGDADSKNEDEELLNKLVLMLTGAESVRQKRLEQRKRLLAHFQSFGDNDDQQLEGLVGREFLALHTYNLLQLLAEVKLGRYDHVLSSHKDVAIISQIKRELLITVQAFHFVILSDIVECKPTIRSAVANAMLVALNELSPGEELIYQTGYTSEPYGHCIYVAFRCEGNQLVVRVDNLGDGIQNRHSVITFQKQGHEVTRYKPYFVNKYAKADLLKNEKLKEYLVDIITARSSNQKDSLNKIYPFVDQQITLAQNYIQTWPAKKSQIVGNCVVKSFLVGTDLRLGKATHRLLRSWESNLLTYVYPNQLQATITMNNNQQTLCGTVKNDKEQKRLLLSIINNDEKFMHYLAKELNLRLEEVKFGSTVEQTLIDFAKINNKQINPRFNCNTEDKIIMFYLNFPNDHTKIKFIKFYHKRCLGIILNTIEQLGKTRIDFDALLFVEKIIPLLKTYRMEQVNSVLPPIYPSPLSQPTQTNAMVNNNQGPTITVHAEEVTKVEPAIEIKESRCLIM